MADFDLQGLLAQFQPTQADQDAARKQAIIAASLGLLGTQHGHEAQALGQAGLLGMQTYTNALNSQQKAAMEKMQAASMAMQLQTNAQAYKDMLQGRDITRQAFNAQAPGMQPSEMAPPPPDAPPQFGMQDRGMGDAPPAMPPMQPAAPAPMQPSGTVSPKQQAYAQFMRAAQIAAQQGRGDLAMQYQEQALKFAPKIFKTEEGTDPQGNRVQVNYYDDGTHQILSDVGPAKKEAKQVDTGAVIGFVDPFTGQPIAGGGLYNKTMTPGEVASNQIAQGNLKVAQGNLGVNNARLGIERGNQDIRRAEVDPMGFLGINKSGAAAPQPGQAQSPVGGAMASGKTGDEFLATLPPSLAAQVKGLSNGDIPFPSSFALKSPYWQGMISLLTQYDPNFDAINYQARAKTRNDFTSGKSAQSMNAINTTMGHLDTLDKMAQGLNNTNYPVINSVVNAVGKQVDPNLKGRLNAMSTQVQAVASEMERVYRQAGGSTRDIEEWKSNLSTADSYPAIHAAIQSGIKLLDSKLNALGDQYNKGMGTTKDGLELLSPSARAAYNRLTGATAGAPSIDDLVKKYAK